MAIHGGELVLQPLLGEGDNGTAQGSLALQPLAVSASLSVGQAAEGALSFEPLQGDGSLEGPIAFEALTLEADLPTGEVATADLTLAPLSLDAQWGMQGDGRLEALALEGTVLRGNVAQAPGLSLQPLAVAGTLLFDGEGEGESALEPLRLSASASSSIVGAANVVGANLRALTLEGEMLPGAVGLGSVELPLITLDAQGFGDVTGSAVITFPVLALAGVVAQSTDGADIGNALVLNTRTRAVSRYASFPANSLATWQGVVLAACADGIVALQGDTDDGEQIDAYLRGGVTDFGKQTLSRVTYGYVDYRTNGDMYLKLITNESVEHTYSLMPRAYDTALQPARVKFGKGVKGRFWQWEIGNESGASLELGGLQLHGEETTRRV